MAQHLSRRAFVEQLAVAGASLAVPWQARAEASALVIDLLGARLSDDEKLMFCCLQGLLNRTGPRLYLHLQRSDPQWLAWYREHHGLAIRELADPYDVFDALGLKALDVVVTDPEAPHSHNIAASYAAVQDLVPLSPALLDHPRLPDRRVRVDLRGRFRGQEPVEVYQRLLEPPFDTAARDAIGCLDVQTGGIPAILRYHHIRDVMVARRCLCLGLSSHPVQAPEETALKQRFFDRLAPFFQVYGWHTDRDGERDHVAQITAAGGLTLCSSEASNFSFHRHLPALAPFRQPQRPRQVTLRREKVYTCFIYSDGDSLNHFSRGHGYSYFHERRGEVAMGWEVQPLLADLAPGLLEYFYANATAADTFVGSASGLGYQYPERMTADALRSLLRRTLPYLARLDLTSFQVLSYPSGPRTAIDSGLRRIYADELGGPLRAVFEGYWTTAGEPSLVGELAWLVTRLPVLRKTSIPQQIINELRKAAEADARPAFLPIHLPKGHMNYADVLDIAAALDDRVVIVSPDELAEAYRQAGG